MTATAEGVESTTEGTEPRDAVTILSEDPRAVDAVKQGMAKVAAGKISLVDLFQSVVAKADPEDIDKAPPVSPPLSEAEKDAIRRLPEVFGKVKITADRALTLKEQKALVEEREVVDTVLKVLEKRKDKVLRELFANHLDSLLTAEEREAARIDAKGHYAVKQDVSVPETGMKIQRSVSGGKPVLTIATVERLYAEGKIDRPTYLKITRKPDMPRVLDEAGMHAAIQKDPSLFFLLGFEAEPTRPTTTIKVCKDT